MVVYAVAGCRLRCAGGRVLNNFGPWALVCKGCPLWASPLACTWCLLPVAIIVSGGCTY
jgi:hypothetical protein